MKPDLEGPEPYLEAMKARGWFWCPETKRFRTEGGGMEWPDRPTLPIIMASVYERAVGEWRPDYGIRGASWGSFRNHATPLLAAEEAEEWIHNAVRGLAGVRVPDPKPK